MGNVLRILIRDFKRLIKAPAAMIVVGALLVLPSLYTWYNVLAFWNPYDATGNLRVCVVNQDVGTSTDMTGELNVGSKIVEEMSSNDQLDWVTTLDYDAAMGELQVGDVYAVYVLPEDFSACLVSPLTGEVKSPHIQYYANEKLGPVSPKITDAAASALDQKINSAFVATVTEAATKAIDDAANKAEVSVDSAKSKADNRAKDVKAVVAEVHDTLAGLQDTINEGRSKVATANDAIAGATAITADAQAVLKDVTDEANALLESLSGLSSDTLPMLSDVMADLAQVTMEAAEVADRIAATTGEARADIDMAAAKIQPVINAMWDTVADLELAASEISDGKLKEKLLEEAQDIRERADRAQAVLDGAVTLAEDIEAVSQKAVQITVDLDEAASAASDRLAEYSDDLYGSAASTVTSSVAQVGTVSARLSTAVSDLDAAIAQAGPALEQLDGVLADCGEAIAQTNALVGDVQSDLDMVMTDAHMLAQSGVIANLLENGTLNAQNISEFMGAPTELSTTKFYHPNAYGAAMAPLFMNLTFWIGAFMLVIIFLLEVDSEGIEGLKPWQRYLGRFLMFSIFAVLQALICCVGTLALGVQAANAPALFLASAITALAYLSIIYMLSSTFKHVGKGLCIVLVFAQIPGGSGLYPVEMTSSFFQAIYPLLPFTYGIDAMREAVFGFYGNNFAHDMIALAVFFFGNLALGLALVPLMSNVVRMTARQIHEGDLYNGEDAITPGRPYRLTQMLRALTEKEDYRQKLEASYARFLRRYPLIIRASIVLGVGIPVVLGFLFALSAAEKVLLLTLLLIWLILLIGFLVVIESRRYSLERQLNLENMSTARLLSIYSDRNRMVRASLRLTSRRSSAGAESPSDEGNESARGSSGVEGSSVEGEGSAPNGPDAGAVPQASREARGGIRNVWLIARNDFSGLFKNVMSVVITVGLVVLPSLFAWYNILACWNVFDNTGLLSVAVASEDEGFESDLIPINVNIGEKVVSALHENDQINWVFTDAEDAVEGTKAGKYYAALVIPEGFSKDMLTFYQGDSVSATINYYINEKKNAIAPNIIGTGADMVSYEVNSTFASTLSEVAVGVAQSLSKLADEGDANGRIASLADHLRKVSSRLDQSADVLGLYSSLTKDSQKLVSGSVKVLKSARSRVENAASDIEAGKQQVQALIANLGESIDNLDAAMENAKQAVSDLGEQADEMISEAVDDVPELTSRLWAKALEIDEKAAELSDIVAKLEKLRDELKSGITKEKQYEDSGELVDVELDAEIEVRVENTLILDKDIAALKKAIGILEEASAACRDAAEGIEQGVADVQEAADTLKKLVAQAEADVEAARSDLMNDLKPGIDQLKQDIAILGDDLNTGTERLKAVSPDLSGAMDAVSEVLGTTATKVDESVSKLHGAAQSVRLVADAVDGVLKSGDTEKLRALLQGDASDLAQALSAPVQVERIALYPSENFGSAMAPLYCTLALFIGSLLIMVAMKPEVSRRGREQLCNPKPRHLFFGRFCAVAAVSLMQTTLLGLGNMLFLKVQVAEPLLFMLCFWISGLVLAFIIYTLVVSFGNLGKAIAVLLLIVQVTACGGSYPLQILPDFVQAISPWVPATYIVDALRAAMMGVYQNDFWVSMGLLAMFLIPFLALGLVLRKPMERFMKFYVSKVEECHIME